VKPGITGVGVTIGGAGAGAVGMAGAGCGLAAIAFATASAIKLSRLTVAVAGVVGGAGAVAVGGASVSAAVSLFFPPPQVLKLIKTNPKQIANIRIHIQLLDLVVVAGCCSGGVGCDVFSFRVLSKSSDMVCISLNFF